MKTSVPCLSGLQGNSQFIGSTKPSELLGVVVSLLSDDQNGVLTGADDFGDVIRAVGQADRNRKVGGGFEHFTDGDRTTRHGQVPQSAFAVLLTRQENRLTVLTGIHRKGLLSGGGDEVRSRYNGPDHHGTGSVAGGDRLPLTEAGPETML